MCKPLDLEHCMHGSGRVDTYNYYVIIVKIVSKYISRVYKLSRNDRFSRINVMSVE